MKAKKGDNVKVEYEGRFESGEVFDSSSHGDHSHPLRFQIGSGQVIKGFDEALEGMEVDQEKEVTIKPEDAYGHPNSEMIKDFPRNALPKDQEPKEGMMLILNTPDGHQFPAKIVKVTETSVSIDLNHPLAGKTLIFKLKLKGINLKEDPEEEHHHH